MTRQDPPSFEEMTKNIDDPDYGLGVIKLWQFPENWLGTKAAKIHDLRYDYLKPGESTQFIDKEFWYNAEEEGVPAFELSIFYGILCAWGQLFQYGKDICEYRGWHNWKACSYGQKNSVYDYRCVTCGLHKPLDAGDEQC